MVELKHSQLGFNTLQALLLELPGYGDGVGQVVDSGNKQLYTTKEFCSS